MTGDETFDLPLTDLEREVLLSGLTEWGGPASCTEEFAVAMGFTDVAGLFAESDRLRAALRQRRPLTRVDWVRTLLATEVVFISDVVGAGAEWPITTGLSDEETLGAIRALQRKIRGRGVVGAGIGTRPSPDRQPGGRTGS